MTYTKLSSIFLRASCMIFVIASGGLASDPSDDGPKTSRSPSATSSDHQVLSPGLVPSASPVASGVSPVSSVNIPPLDLASSLTSRPSSRPPEDSPAKLARMLDSAGKERCSWYDVLASIFAVNYKHSVWEYLIAIGVIREGRVNNASELTDKVKEFGFGQSAEEANRYAICSRLWLMKDMGKGWEIEPLVAQFNDLTKRIKDSLNSKEDKSVEQSPNPIAANAVPTKEQKRALRNIKNVVRILDAESKVCDSYREHVMSLRPDEVSSPTVPRTRFFTGGSCTEEADTGGSCKPHTPPTGGSCKTEGADTGGSCKPHVPPTGGSCPLEGQT